MKKIDINQLEIKEISNTLLYASIVESLLFTSGEPLKLKDIAAILECSSEFAEELMEKLKHEYDDSSRGIKLISINDEYQLVTKPENSQYVQRLLKVNTRQSLSQAALETLAIVAYKQPITRVSIDEIRGVKSDRAIATLLDRGFIKESGRLEVAGRPMLFSTTDKFLMHFGLENLSQMPSLDDLFNMDSEITITESDNEDNAEDNK
jgi:segregation and condensation protein B